MQNGNAPLLFATRKRHVKVVQILLKYGADPNVNPKVVELVCVLLHVVFVLGERGKKGKKACHTSN